MNSSFNKKIGIVTLGSLGLLVADYILKKMCIVAGINTQYAIAYNILNLCSFAVVVLAGGKLISTQIGKEQKGYFIARFLFILAAFLINSSILIP